MDERTRLALTKQTFDGRPALAPVSPFRWLEALCAWGLKPRVVPADSWRLVDGEIARVSCACGRSADAPLAVFAAHCECGRRFVFDGTTVWSLLAPEALGVAAAA